MESRDFNAFVPFQVDLELPVIWPRGKQDSDSNCNPGIDLCNFQTSFPSSYS